MADEQDRWLNRDAAERLLRGEPLEAVDADTRKQADRLAEALGRLAAAHPPTSEELPGEVAALAAFREARAGRNGEQEVLGRRSRTHTPAHSSDAGLVRLGRPSRDGRRARWGRPVRFGMAAALAAGMIGGVAVAAGTGVLPTPFGGDDPGPAATASAAVTPQQPLLSPSPGAMGTDGPGSPKPEDTGETPSTGGSSRDEAGNGSAATGRPGSAEKRLGTGRSREWWAGVLSSCRAMRAGKSLDEGRWRNLEDAAGDRGRVKSYCRGVLGENRDGRSGDDQGSGDSRGGQVDKDGKNGDGQGGDDDGHHIRPGGHGVISVPSPVPPATLAPLHARTGSPTPTYSALGLS